MAAIALVFVVGFLSDKVFLNGVYLRYLAIQYDFVTVPLITILIWSLSNIKNSVAIKIFSWKIVGFLGKVSYYFYLTQAMVIHYTKELIAKNVIKMDVMSFKYMLIALMCNLILAIVLYLFVNKVVFKFFIIFKKKREMKQLETSKME